MKAKSSKSSHGGARPGAGRPRKILPSLAASPEGETPLEFLLRTMRDPAADPRVRLEAAKAAAPYVHHKAGDAGKKAAADAAAQTAHLGTEWGELLELEHCTAPVLPPRAN